MDRQNSKLLEQQLRESWNKKIIFITYLYIGLRKHFSYTGKKANGKLFFVNC